MKGEARSSAASGIWPLPLTAPADATPSRPWPELPHAGRRRSRAPFPTPRVGRCDGHGPELSGAADALVSVTTRPILYFGSLARIGHYSRSRLHSRADPHRDALQLGSCGHTRWSVELPGGSVRVWPR